MMDLFEMSIEPTRYVSWAPGHGFQPVTIRVNGVELIDLVGRIERPFAEAEFDRRSSEGESQQALGPRGGLAGSYLYLPVADTFLPSRNLLGEPYTHGFEGRGIAQKSLLLQCTCGVRECWFLLARITVEDHGVTWSDFEQFHRDWHYDLGPFVFARDQYEEQLAASPGC